MRVDPKVMCRKIKAKDKEIDFGVPLEIKSTSPSSFPQRRLMLHYDVKTGYKFMEIPCYKSQQYGNLSNSITIGKELNMKIALNHQ
ncbi:hypothetical protein CsatA_005973 [Cannabis sativa]